MTARGRWSRAPRRTTGGLVLLLLAGCGLPQPDGVQRTDPVAPRAALPADVRVLPPGPRADASPAAIVEGFLDAQSSPDDGRAIARTFLARGSAWDVAETLVYAPDSRRVRVDPAAPGRVVVELSVLGTVRADGTFDPSPRTVRDDYRLRREDDGWRIATPPRGLRLTPGDRDRSFRVRALHWLAAAEDGPRAEGRLVPEPVFLPVDGDPVRSLVDRLLEGPSVGLAPAVRSALPVGSRVVGDTPVDRGTLRLSLDTRGRGVPQPDRELLLAQLVWTLRQLPDVSQLEVVLDGRRLAFGGRDRFGRDDVVGFDPDLLPTPTRLVYVQERRLRLLDADEGDAPLVDAPVDEVAVHPDGGVLAALTRQGGGSSTRAVATTVSTGAVAGPLTRRVTATGLSSPSWGSAAQGLWLLRRGSVVVLPPAGDGPDRLVDVEVEGSGAVSAIAVSRDGARVALVRGDRLLVGRVEVRADTLRLAGLRAVAPGVRGVTDVSWESGRVLVVLARATPQVVVPFRVAVDGSSVQPVGRVGLVGTPVALAAAPGQRLAVATVVPGPAPGAGPRVYVDDGRFFQRGIAGSAPAYPG